MQVRASFSISQTRQRKMKNDQSSFCFFWQMDIHNISPSATFQTRLIYFKKPFERTKRNPSGKICAFPFVKLVSFLKNHKEIGKWQFEDQLYEIRKDVKIRWSRSLNQSTDNQNNNIIKKAREEDRRGKRIWSKYKNHQK